MPNYDEEGYFTDDPVVVAMFLGETIRRYDWSDGLETWTAPERLTEVYKDRYCIPWGLVKSAIAPVDGEAFVEIGFGDVATDGLILYGANDTMTNPDVEKRLNWRVINICQDYGQLRELLAAIERCG